MLKLNKGTTYTLNKPEQFLARYIARGRYRSARKNNRTNAKIGDQSDKFTDLEGISGEIAFCRLINVFPYTTIAPLSSIEGSDGGDGQLGPYKFDVKTTKYKTGRLLIQPWKVISHVDFYVLMIGEFPTYKFAGMIKTNRLEKQIFKGRECFVAEQKNLSNLRLIHNNENSSS